MIAPGKLLAGKYRIGPVIGRGGMGLVYAAQQEPLGRQVAVKVLKRELLGEPTFVERFRREAKTASSLGHPNIVQVTDLGFEGPDVFLVMERLVGESLGAVVTREGGLPAERVARIGCDILDGLAAAHAAGLIHRDVKPDNVFLVTHTGGRETAKLLDFGLVKQVDATDKLTATHSVLGTWQYMAPEQALALPLDGRADLYSLGACLFFALTRLRPYQAVDMEASMFALSPVPTPPIATRRGDVDPALAAVVERALEKQLDRRWSSALEMRAALEPFANRAVKTRGTMRLATPLDKVVDDETSTLPRGAPNAIDDETTAALPKKPPETAAATMPIPQVAPAVGPPPLVPPTLVSPADIRPPPVKAGRRRARTVTVIAVALLVFTVGLLAGRWLLFR